MNPCRTLLRLSCCSLILLVLLMTACSFPGGEAATPAPQFPTITTTAQLPSATRSAGPSPTPTETPVTGPAFTPSPIAPPLAGSLLPANLQIVAPRNVIALAPLAYLTFEGAAPPAANLAFSPDGTGLALHSDDGRLRLWALPSGEMLRDLETTAGNAGSNAALAFSSPDGRYLAASARMFQEGFGEGWSAVKLWDLYDPGEPRLLPGSSPWGVTSVAFSPDGQTLAAGTREGMGGGGLVKLWEVESGALRLDVPCFDWVSAVVFSPDGATLACASVDRLNLLDSQSGAARRSLTLDDLVRGVTYTPDGRLLVMLSRQLVLLDPASGQRLRTLATTGEVHAMAVSPDGHLVAMAVGQTIQFWDLSSGELRFSQRDQAPVLGLAFSPRGRLLATVNALGRVQLWGVRGQASLPPDTPVMAPENLDRLTRAAQLWVPELWQVTYSGRSDWLALASNAGLRLLELPSLEPLAFLPQARTYGVIYDVSADGRLLAWVADQGRVKVWDTIARTDVREISGLSENCCGQLLLSPDGHLLVTLAGSLAQVWDLATGTQVGSQDGVQQVHISPDGTTLAFTSNRSIQVILWDIASRREVGTLSGYTTAAPFYFTQFSPDGHTMVWGSRANMQLIDVASGELGPEFPLSYAVFSPNGRLLAGYEAGWYGDTYLGQVTLIDTLSGEQVAVLQHAEAIRALAFSPDGRLLVTISGGTVTLWDVATQEALATLPDDPAEALALAFSPDGRVLAVISSGGVVDLWGISTAGVEAPDQPVITVANAERLQEIVRLDTTQPTDLAFSPDGALLAVASQEGTLTLWDWTTGFLVRRLEGHAGWVYLLAFSPGGDTLASASLDGTIRLWDVRTGEQTRLLDGHRGEMTALAFSPDGRVLASASSDGTIRLWDLPDGEARTTLSGHSDWVWGVTFSPDGRLLASASADGTVRLWDPLRGQETAVLRGHTATVWGVAFAPDGLRLASAGWDGTVRIWNVGLGIASLTLTGHRDWVYRVAYSPDGRLLASASADGTVRLWDAMDGAVLATLEGHTDRVWSVAFAPDGRTLASASDDGTVRLWQVVP